MKIHLVRKWVIDTLGEDDFLDEAMMAKLKGLGWLWMDAYDHANSHPFRYGHFYTYDFDLAERTTKEVNYEIVEDRFCG